MPHHATHSKHTKSSSRTPKRKRGAQRGNTNAWRHGMYSALNPSELAAYLREADIVALRSHTRVASSSNTRMARILASRLLSYDEEIEEPGSSASWLAAQFLLARNLGSITRSVSLIRF